LLMKLSVSERIDKFKRVNRCADNRWSTNFLLYDFVRGELLQN